MKTARDRVKGPAPSRRELKAFSKIADVPASLIIKLRQLSENSRNDLGQDHYSLPSNFDLNGTFNAVTGYRQILIQTAATVDPESEVEYLKWEDGLSEIREYISKYFGLVYRFRLSVSDPAHVIPWHIDTDTSVSCRAQICISDVDSIFEFKTKSGIESLKMIPGEMYFINTGWPHRVVAGTETRIVAIFGFQFDDMLESSIIRL